MIYCLIIITQCAVCRLWHSAVRRTQDNAGEFLLIRSRMNVRVDGRKDRTNEKHNLLVEVRKHQTETKQNKAAQTNNKITSALNVDLPAKED